MSNTVTLPSYSIGTNVYEGISSLCSSFEKRILVIGGPIALKKALPKLNKALEYSGALLFYIEIFNGDCTFSEINKMALLAKDIKADMIFGVGGGKALDTAKAAGHISSLPVYTFPTIAATCAAITALSVVYNEDGSFNSFYFLQRPPEHCFINTEIIAEAPEKYLRAGMGDALGKHYEAQFSARGDKLSYSSALGINIAQLCGAPIFQYGKKALEQCEKNTSGEALEYIVLSNIVSTGLVSILVEDCYNCAVAHSLCYGLTTLPSFEENNLHGDVVAYGVLVQLVIDHQQEEYHKLKLFLKSIGTRTSLKEMGISCDYSSLSGVLGETLKSPDMEHLPYKITEEMLWDAIKEVEGL